MSMERIKVFLGDSQVVFREGIHFILESEMGIEVVGEGRTTDEVLDFLQRQPVDVLVLSQDMYDEIGRITEIFPSIGLVFIGDTFPQQQVGNSIFLTRDMDPGELAPAVRKVSCDDVVVKAREQTSEMEEAGQSSMEHLLSLVDAL